MSCPTPPRSDDRQQARAVARQQRSQGRHLGVAPQERRERSGQGGCDCRDARRGHGFRYLGALCGHGFREQRAIVPGEPRASARRRTVSRCGRCVAPFSQLMTDRGLTPARSASSTCVQPRAMRNRRNNFPECPCRGSGRRGRRIAPRRAIHVPLPAQLGKHYKAHPTSRPNTPIRGSWPRPLRPECRGG